MQIMQSDAPKQAETVDMRFNRAEILPPEFFETEEPQAYIVFPLHFKSKEYGYLVLNPAEGQWPNSLVNTHMNSLSSSIENSYYQSQFMELAEIKRLSETDPLTGLYNRRGFEKGLQEALVGFKDGMTISIASIDMDNLKLINDIYGHADGDFALKALSGVLKTCLNPDEVCARFGGDTKHIFACMQMADERMYINKRNYKKSQR